MALIHPLYEAAFRSRTWARGWPKTGHFGYIQVERRSSEDE